MSTADLPPLDQDGEFVVRMTIPQARPEDDDQISSLDVGSGPSHFRISTTTTADDQPISPTHTLAPLESNEDHVNSPRVACVNEGRVSVCNSVPLHAALVQPSIASRLNRSTDEVASIVARISALFGVETLSALSAIPEHILVRQGVPAGFCQLVSSVAEGFGEAESPSEVEKLLWRHGFDAGFSAREINDVIKILVKDNWMDSVAALRGLPASHWSQLGFTDAMTVRRLRRLLEVEESDRLMSKESPDLLDILTRIAPRLNRSVDTMASLYSSKFRSNGIRTLEEYFRLSEKQVQDLQLPVRVVQELETLRPHSAISAPSSSPRKDCEEGNTTWEEPDVTTFIIRVGKVHKHTADEVKVVADVLVKQHWLNTLAQLRELKDEDWEEFYLSRKIVQELRDGLVDPYVLDMTAVWTSPAPLDLFPCDVEFAADQMLNDVPEVERRDVARAFLRLMEVLTLKPNDAAKRSIRKSNPRFAARAKNQESVKLFLLSLGYVDYGSHFLLPVLYLTRIQSAHQRMVAAVISPGGGADEGSLLPFELPSLGPVLDKVKTLVSDSPFSITFLQR